MILFVCWLRFLYICEREGKGKEIGLGCGDGVLTHMQRVLGGSEYMHILNIHTTYIYVRYRRWV
jgi:hypothetical protein